MSPIARVCPHGRITPDGRCDDCRRADQQRRHTRNLEAGRLTARWQRTRRLVLARDGACQHCGTTVDLTVHLANPALGGDHRRATPADCTVFCRSCHGRLDGARAHPRPRFFDANGDIAPTSVASRFARKRGKSG
jgi:5-methylcytosine-specific restriction endonuclease McrA